MPKFADIRHWLFLLVPIFACLTGLIPQDAADPLMMAPFCITAAYILLSGRLSDINLRDPVLLCLLLLWLGWVWGSIFSTVPFASEVTLTVLSVLPLTYIAILNRDTKPLIYGIIALSVVLALGAMGQILISPNAPWRAKLFFEDANTLGAMIVISIPLTLSLYFTHQQRNLKIAIYSCLIILTGGLIATQSRSALLGGLIGVAAVFLKNRDKISLRSTRHILPIAIVIVAGLLVTTFGTRLLSVLNGDKDVLGRLSLWSSAFQMAFINPLHGVGLGTFHLHYPPYKHLNDNSSGEWVHMDPLQWGVETGWGTTFAFYALAAVVAARYLKKDLTQLQIGAGAALLTLFAIDHTSYLLHVVPVLVIAAALLSQFSAPYIPAPRYRYILTSCLMVIISLGLWSVSRTAPTLYFFTSALEGLKAGNAPLYTGNIQRCLDYGDRRFPGCNMEAARLVIQTSSNPPEAALVWLANAERANMLSPEPNSLRAAYHLKKEPDSLNLPIEELTRALVLDPSYWPARRMLVELYMRQGKNQLALDTLEIAENYWIAGNAVATYHQIHAALIKKMSQ